MECLNGFGRDLVFDGSGGQGKTNDWLETCLVREAFPERTPIKLLCNELAPPTSLAFYGAGIKFYVGTWML